MTTTNYGLAWWADQAPPPPAPSPEPSDIEGQAWVDTNGNGTREPGLGDAGLPHVWVQLIDAADQVVDQVTTDAAGGYQFEGVAPGSYTVKFVTPERAAVATQDVYDPLTGADDTNDSDINTLGVVSVTLAGSDVVNVDAGYTFNNSIPIGVTNTYTAPHSGSLTVSAANGVLANDSDPENATLTAKLVSAPKVGTFTLASDGSFVYAFDPTIGFSGSLTFAYRPDDDAGPGYPVTVTIAINNMAPIASTDSVSTNEDTPVTVSVLANDSDPDSDSLVIVGFTYAAHGAVGLTDTGIRYIPDADWSGTDTFTYTVDDGFGGIASSTATVTVNPVNDAPVAVDDGTFSVLKNGEVTIDVRVNDTDVDGDALTIIAVTPGANGTVTFIGTSVTYTPNTDFTGNDSFTYTISDGNGGTHTATVFVTVDPPVTITGSIWLDFNANGIQDAGEPLDMAPVTVYLYDGVGNLLATTTAINGTYTFNNLLPGTYQVRFELPPGKTVSPQDAGGNDEFDNDFNSSGHSALFTLVPGANIDLDLGWL